MMNHKGSRGFPPFWHAGFVFALLVVSQFAPVQAATSTAPGSTLIMGRVECVDHQVAIDLTSGQPTNRHEVLQSPDLQHWQVAPKATFQRMSDTGLRASLPAGGTEPSMFYRILCVDAAASPVRVNLQVDAELEDTQGLRNLTSELKKRGINTTVYVSADYANRNATLVADLFRQGFEIALHGYYTGEQLETMTYAEQKDLLTRAKKAVEGCRPCGTYRPVVGFRPQYFSQNESTFRVLDELGLTYNSGFKFREIYLPGHAEDPWPYLATGHLFSAVPITTVEEDSGLAYLCDIACAQALHWTATRWEQALMTSLTDALATRQPLVLLLHGWYTGDQAKYTYWQPVLNFLDAAQGRVQFVTSSELVNLAPR